MFKADYTDVKLKKIRSFPNIGDSDTLRVFEPTARFISEAYKDDEARQRAIMAEIAKNTFVIIDDKAIEFSKKENILNYISAKEGQKLQKTFIDFITDDDEVNVSQDPK